MDECHRTTCSNLRNDHFLPPVPVSSSWYLYRRVTQNTVRTRVDKMVFFENYFEFVTAVDINNCLEQIKLQISLEACALSSELPSDLSTMHFPAIFTA